MTLTQISSRGVEDTLRWSLGASGTDHYTFTGPGLTGTVNDPTIYLSRGQTYIFENNNSANAHPFRIQSTAGQSGTAYNTGVTNNGGAGGTEIKITVPHDAPDNLYYQCTAHANMNGIIYITGAVAAGSITTAKLEDSTGTTDGVTTAKLANLSVTTSKLAADSVTSAKIYPNAVDNAALGSNAVSSGNISADAVTDVKLSDHASDNSLRAVGTNHIKDESVTLAKLEHGTSSNDGKFLRANNGADPTFETIDLTALSASNLTSGTIPDARFPATLPAASGANLTSLAAANLTGTLPAISGANLTNLPGGGKITRIFQTSAGTDYQNANWGDYMSITVTNVPSSASRYLLFISYNQQTQNASYPSYGRLQTTNASPSGYNFTHTTTTAQSSIFHNGFTFDAGNSTSNRTYKIQHRASSWDYNKQSILSSGSMVIFELDMS